MRYVTLNFDFINIYFIRTFKANISPYKRPYTHIREDLKKIIQLKKSALTSPLTSLKNETLKQGYQAPLDYLKMDV